MAEDKKDKDLPRELFDRLMIDEGGSTLTDDPNDPGGKTKFGFAQKYHKDKDVTKLTKEDAYQAANAEYWQQLDDKDKTYSGLQRIFNSPKIYKDTKGAENVPKAQMLEYIDRIEKNPSKSKYANGWFNRAAGKLPGEVYAAGKTDIRNKSPEELRKLVDELYPTTTKQEQESIMPAEKKNKRGIMDRLEGAAGRLGSAWDKTKDKAGGLYDRANEAWANSSLNEDYVKSEYDKKTAEKDKQAAAEKENEVQAKADNKGQYQQQLAEKQKKDALDIIRTEKANIDKDAAKGGAGEMRSTVDSDTNKGKPEAVDQNLANLEKALDNLKGTGELTTKEKDEWKAQIQDIRERARAKAGDIQNAELAERLGHALSKMFAAMHGLRTGTDMSGVKFEKTDWNARMKTAMSFMDEELGAAKAGRDASARARSEDRTQQRQTLMDKFAIAKEQRAINAQASAEKRQEAAGGRDERRVALAEGAPQRKSEQDKKASAEKLTQDVTKKTDTAMVRFGKIKLEDATAQKAFLNEFGVPPEQQAKMIGDKSMWGDTPAAAGKIRSMVEKFYLGKLSGGQAAAPQQSNTAPQSAEKPNVIQNGVTFTWNGTKYVEAK